MFSIYNLYLKIHMNILHNNLVMFPKDFLSSPVINEFVLSHILMPLSQAGATI